MNELPRSLYERNVTALESIASNVGCLTWLVLAIAGLIWIFVMTFLLDWKWP